MATKALLWSCDICGGLFNKKEEAEKCEKIHASIDDMVIVDVKFADIDKTFPSGLLVEYGGSGAVYDLKRISSIEDFEEENGGW